MKRRPEQWLALGAVLLLSALARQASAEEFRLQVPRLEFLNEYHTFKRGDSLVVQLQNFEISRHPELCARLFWGTKEEIPTRPYGSVKGRGEACYFYKSTLIRRLQANRLSVNLGAVPTTGSDWVVVFEDGNWGDGKITITKSAVFEYFRRGYQFRVAPPPAPRTPPVILAVLGSIFGLGPKTADASRSTPVLPAPTRTPVETAASDKVDCIHFLNVNEEVLVGQAGRCSGCDRTGTEQPAGVFAWLGRFGAGWL